MNLENYCYVPTVRTSQNNLGAILELSDEVKDLIIPRLVVRQDKRHFDSFLNKWGNDRPYFLEISKYPSDMNDPFNQKLNDPNQNFINQYSLFDEYKQSNIIPVINESSVLQLRNVLQLTIKVIQNIGRIGLKLDIGNGFNESINLITTMLAILNDEQITNTVLIVDAGKIDSIGDIQQNNLTQALQLISNYKDLTVVFSSTSFPRARPIPNHSENYPCIDPIWQYPYIAQLHSQNIKAIYGDCSASDPYSEQYEYNFAVKPIPYASYLLKDDLEWLSIRKGRGAEYDKFREIAKDIKKNPNYHGDNFCYATQEIADIANNVRTKAGNQAFWAKLKINQHISAIVDAHKSKRLGGVIIYNPEYDDWDSINYQD